MPASANPARARTEASTGSSTGSAPPDYRVEALAKGLRVLSVFSEQRPTWRITDIAAEVSLPLPTAYRIVMTLTAEGYLDHLPSGEYRPGVRVLTLGTAALRSLDLVELATPKLQDLANATRETVNLAVLSRRPAALSGPAAQLRPGHGQHPGRLAAARRAHLDRQAAARLSGGGGSG